MKPVSPVIPGMVAEETVFAKNQAPYQPLPSLIDAHGYVLSRWKLSWKERVALLFSGNLYHWQGAFGGALQPVSMRAGKLK